MRRIFFVLGALSVAAIGLALDFAGDNGGSAAGAAGSGSTVYPATATASFPYGLAASSIFSNGSTLSGPTAFGANANLPAPSISSPKSGVGVLDPTAKIIVSPGVNVEDFAGGTLMHDGRLLCAFTRQRVFEGTPGAVMATFSSDLGLTWSVTATTIAAVNVPSNYSWGNVMARTLRTGEVIVSFGGGDTTDAASTGLFVSRSLDNGATWSAPTRASPVGTDVSEGGSGVYEMDNGTLVLPYQTGADVYVTFSTDKGVTWGGDVLAMDGSVGVHVYTEANVGQFSDNALILMARDTTTTKIATSTSTSRGATWFAPVQAFDGNSRPSVEVLPSDGVLTTYRQKVTGYTAYRMSWDKGATWQAETLVDSNSNTYSATTQIGGGVVGMFFGESNKIKLRYFIDGAGTTPTGNSTLKLAVGVLGSIPVSDASQNVTAPTTFKYLQGATSNGLVVSNGSGSTSAQIGATLPLYGISDANQSDLGFNLKLDGATWKFGGAGYGGGWIYTPSNGYLSWYSSSASGSAGGTATVGSKFNFGPSGQMRNLSQAAGLVQTDSNGIYFSASTTTAVKTVAVATQTIVSSGTVTADQCGGIKRISSAGVVKSSTTTTFSSVTANTQCLMAVCNVGSFNITLDDNAGFYTIGDADVLLTPDDCVDVAFDGAKWRQRAPVATN